MSRTMKDSGIPWIGEIPNHWELLRARYMFNQSTSKGNERLVLLSATQDRGVVDKSTLDSVVQVAANVDLSLFKTVHKNDFVISLRSFQGGFEISHEEGVISPAYTVFRLINQDYPHYYRYLFKSYGFIDKINSLTVGIREGKNIQYVDFSNMLLPFPPLAEQHLIATFLDKKCSEIDSLIDLQEQIIEELKAYKQSVITEAVTKGLNPNVQMKDSGIEWIGEIPENSSLSRIGFCVGGYKAGPFGSTLITGNLLTEGKILVYTPEHIAKLTTEIPNNLYLQEERLNEMSQFLVKEGEVIFPIVGSLGRAMRVTSNMPVGIINQRLSKFSIKEDIVDADYFMWIFGKSSFYQTYIEMYQRGSFIVNLTKTLVYDMPIVLHSITEQQAIADYLDKKCGEIDELITIKQQKIESLKEYKKSVIYEYVTGKREV